jgi:hypothetical protein
MVDGHAVAEFAETILGIKLTPWQRRQLIQVYDQPVGRRGAARDTSPRIDHP